MLWMGQSLDETRTFSSVVFHHSEAHPSQGASIPTTPSPCIVFASCYLRPPLPAVSSATLPVGSRRAACFHFGAPPASRLHRAKSVMHLHHAVSQEVCARCLTALPLLTGVFTLVYGETRTPGRPVRDIPYRYCILLGNITVYARMAHHHF